MSAMYVVGRPRAPLRGARAGGRQRWRARPQSQAARSCLTVFCALTSRAIKDKDFRQLCYVNVTNQLHGLVAMRALQNCGLSLPVEHQLPVVDVIGAPACVEVDDAGVVANWTTSPLCKVSGGLSITRSPGARPVVTSTLSPKS